MGNGFHTLYVSILRYKAIPGTSHTFYDIVNRYTRIPVADPLLCCMFPLDGLLGAAVDTRDAVFAAVLKFRFFIFQYNIPAGADPLANTAADTSIIHMKSCVSVQFIIRIKLIKHSVPDMEPKWSVAPGCNHFCRSPFSHLISFPEFPVRRTCLGIILLYKIRYRRNRYSIIKMKPLFLKKCVQMPQYTSGKPSAGCGCKHIWVICLNFHFIHKLCHGSGNAPEICGKNQADLPAAAFCPLIF